MRFTKKAIRTKGRILKAARELINSRSFDRVSVEDITREAGVAKGTFYHYFTTKEELVKVLCEERVEKLQAEALAMEGTLAERLNFYFLELIRDGDRAGVHLMRRWLRDLMDPEVLDEENLAPFKNGTKDVETILQSAKERGELKPNTPVVMLSHLFMSHLYGAVTLWCMMGGSYTLQSAADKYQELDVGHVLRGYLTDPDS
ncbi:MAG: helix-turn-helix domain-containing protein [Dialister sp.]|nr:helix-turn-helix domain-containing protein [Dialister sp.]